ncbi:MAG: 16S rRNA (uracil(1498)-N(3))-methyltransferase [Oscillospiraceae bacterium]|nr:16S rRNA (uracil(1498)-N(3))-methyltransferase [Oscillospiraceae bacterium]
MARFFMAGTNLLKGPTAIIRGRDAEHIQVLRIRPGEDVTICDTEGKDYKCRLVRADREEAEVEILEVTPCKGEPDVRVTVLCGLPKGDRVDYIIQKSVEAGASEIVFFQSARCVAKPEDPYKKLERWNRISEEAAKQSGRGIIPKVSWAPDYGEVLNIAVHTELPLFMYETGEREPLNTVLEANKEIRSAAVITGPEGGFEKYEADLARIAGLHICSMGERILRCETAPVVAVTALMYATGNLS